jgi:hypothetical protein
VGGPKTDKLGAQRLLARRVERRERAGHRAVVRAEEVHDGVRRERVGKAVVAPRESKVGDAVAEALAHRGLVAPEYRRRHVRRRDVLRDDLEHLADESTGRPVRHRDLPAGTAHANELGGDALGPRREHRTHQTHDDVEAVIVVRQRLGVALVERDLEPLGRRAGSSPLQPVGGDVTSGGASAGAGGDERDLPGAAGDVEQPAPRRDANAAIEQLRVLLHVPREEVVVSGHPRRLEPRFERVDLVLIRRIHRGRIHSECLLRSCSRHVPFRVYHLL